MTDEPNANGDALVLAEMILQSIYGEQLEGCPARPEEIVAVIQQARTHEQVRDRQLLELCETVIEAVRLLSVPPGGAQPATPGELNNLLSERLDSIQELVNRAQTTMARARTQGHEPV